MVKVRGQYSNGNTAKQTAGQKISGVKDVASTTSPVPGVKNSTLQKDLEFDRVFGLLRQVAYEAIPADHEHFK